MLAAFLRDRSATSSSTSSPRSHSPSTTTGDLVGERVELRHDPRCPDDLLLVFHRGAYRDVARLLDRHANASGRRRALPAAEPAGDAPGIDAIGLIADEYDRTLHGAPNRRDDHSDDDSEDGAA